MLNPASHLQREFPLSARYFKGDFMKTNDAWNLLGLQDDRNIQFVLEQLIQIGLRILNATQGSLLVMEPDRKNLKFAMVASRPGLTNLHKYFVDLAGKTVPVGEGITGMAALTHDIQTSTRASGDKFFQVRGDGSPNAVLAAPMLIGEHLIGVITAVCFDKRKSFTKEECHTYGMFANIAAVVVDQQQRLAALAHAPMAEAMGTQERKECELVRRLLEIVRSKPERIDAIGELLHLLGRM